MENGKNYLRRLFQTVNCPFHIKSKFVSISFPKQRTKAIFTKKYIFSLLTPFHGNKGQPVSQPLMSKMLDVHFQQLL